MSKALVITGGLVAQIAAAATLNVDKIDAIAESGTLSLGDSNATTVNLGTHANTTTLAIGGTGLATLNIGTGMGATGVINIGGPAGSGPSGAQVNINANLRVEGTETIIGDTTFNNPVTFTEEVTFGDEVAPITTITYHSSTRTISNIYFGNDHHGLYGADGVVDSAGYTLGITGGTGGAASATGGGAGGSAGVTGGQGGAGTGALNPGAGGDVYILGGLPGTGGTGNAGGGSVYLYGGTGRGTGADGHVYFGNSGEVDESDNANANLLFANTAVGTPAGLRYNRDASKWQARSDSGTWTDLALGSPLPSGTAGYILQYNGSSWTSTNPAALHGMNTTLGFAATTGGTGYSLSLFGQQNDIGGNLVVAGGVGVGGHGGYATLAGGDGSTDGGQVTVKAGEGFAGAGGLAVVQAGNGTTTGGLLSLAAGDATSGVGGNVSVTAGDGSTGGGNIVLQPGVGTTSGNGNVFFGIPNSNAETDFQIFANTSEPGFKAGLRYDPTSSKWQIRPDAGTGDWTNIATGTIAEGYIEHDHLFWDGTQWNRETDLVLAYDRNGSIYPATHTIPEPGKSLTVRGGHANTMGAGGDLYLSGGDADISAGTTDSPGGTVHIAGGHADGDAVGGAITLDGGFGDLGLGAVKLGDNNTSVVQFGGTAATNISFLGHADTRVTSNMTWAETTAGDDYVLSIDASTAGAGNGFQLIGGAGLTNSIGGQIELVSGAGTGTQAGDGATLVLAGGAAAGANATLAAGQGGTTGGSLYLKAGAGASAAANGSVILGDNTTLSVQFGGTAATTVNFLGNAGTRITSDMTWAEKTPGSPYTLQVDTNTTGAGNPLYIYAGMGANNFAGGSLEIAAGNGNGTEGGDGALLTLSGGSSAGANATLAAAGGSTAGGNLALQAGNGSAGIGGNVTVTAGNGTTGGSIILTTGVGTSGGNGNIVFGHTGGTGESDFQIFADTNDGTAEAGIRYDPTASKWQLRPDATATWSNIATGSAIGDGSDDYQHLEWDGGSWQPVNSITLPNVSGLSIKPAANSAGSGQKLVVSAGEGNTQPGGDLSLRGGFGKASTNGSVLIGDSTTSTVVLGVTNTWTFTTSTGLLAPAGTANINLPSLFQINGSATSVYVTAANLGTLTAGSGSNADALHTHASGSATFVAYTSPVSGENLNAGAPLGVENNAGTSTVYHADANAAGTRHYCVGLASAAATSPATTTVVTSGERTIADAIWDTKPVAADTGKLVYLSENAGKLTYTPPETAGSIMQVVGIITFADASAGTTRVSVMIGSPVAL